MSAHHADFDGDLDRVLALWRDPDVAADLARRIVVRTTHLPQVTASPTRHPRRSHLPVPLRRAWNWQPWGGAIAASLLLMLLTQGSEGLPLAGAHPRVDKGTTAPASEPEARAPVAHGTTGAPVAIQPRSATVELAALEAETSAPDPSNIPRSEEQVGEDPVRLPDEARDEGVAILARNSEQSALRSPLDQFTLAENGPAPAQVYGPVLAAEEQRFVRGLGRSSTPAGLAISQSSGMRSVYSSSRAP